MQILSTVMAVFAVLGLLDLICGNRLGLGAECKRGLFMLGELSLSMVGMIVLSPVIAKLLTAPLQGLYAVLHIDPSAWIACLLANDMGGADLAGRLAADPTLGRFNGLIIGSMMGATLSFTLPFVMGSTEKAQRNSILLGLICGISTIPVGCFAAGLFCGIAVLPLLLDMIPLLLLSVLCSLGLCFFRNAGVKICNIFGIVIRTVVLFGLAVGIFEYLTGLDIVPYTAPLEDGFFVILSIVAVMMGAFPLLYLLTKILKKPLRFLSGRTGLSEIGIVGFLATLATSVTTFGMMKDMDDRSVTLNAAFAVSAAFTLADHLAFTMAFDSSYLWQMILGKLVSGITALLLAAIILKKQMEKPAAA